MLFTVRLCTGVTNPLGRINTGFPNGPSFRYGNFFLPRVEKTSKNYPTENLTSQGPVGVNQAIFCFLLSFDNFFDARPFLTKNNSSNHSQCK